VHLLKCLLHVPRESASSNLLIERVQPLRVAIQLRPPVGHETVAPLKQNTSRDDEEEEEVVEEEESGGGGGGRDAPNASHIAVKVELGILVIDRNHLREVDERDALLVVDHQVELVKVAMDHTVLS